MCSTTVLLSLALKYYYTRSISHLLATIRSAKQPVDFIQSRERSTEGTFAEYGLLLIVHAEPTFLTFVPFQSIITARWIALLIELNLSIITPLADTRDSIEDSPLENAILEFDDHRLHLLRFIEYIPAVFRRWCSSDARKNHVLTLWLPRWSYTTGYGFSCGTTVVIGDRSSWTSYNCKNWMKIDSWGILNITDKQKILWNKKCPIERLNIFIRTSIKKWERVLHLTVHCVCVHIFEG